jgi:hypothetical protein
MLGDLFYVWGSIMKNKLTLAAIAISSMMGAVPAMAATVIPVSATASSSYPTYGAGSAIDQGAGSATTDWAAGSTGNGSYLNLDLGAQYFLTSAIVTDRVTSGGANGGFVGGLFDYTTSFSLSYYADSSFSGAALATYNFSKYFPPSTSSPNDFAYTAALGGPKVQFVRYTVLTATGVNPGLSNISFAGSVPEVSTWAMMLVGLGLVGGGLRYRQRKTATVTYA